MKKNGKLVSLLILVALVLSLVLAGCAPGPTATPSPTPTITTKPTTTATPSPTPTATTKPTTTATPSPTPTATAAPIVLKWVMLQGPDHRNAQLAKKVIQLIEQGSKGRIKFEFYPGDILVKDADAFRAVAEGIVQMGQVSAADWSDRLRLATIVQMPLTAPDTKTYWQSIYKLYETNPELVAEHLKWNIKPIYLYGSGGFDVSNTKRPVKVLEDLKGLKLRAAGGYYVAAAELLGAIPISISSSEVYMAIQRKVLDGGYMGIDTQAAYKIQEVVKFVTLAELQFGTAAVVMNLDVWNKLPADLQQLFNEVVKQSVAPDVIEYVINERQRAIDAFKKAGVEVYELPLAEKSKWAEIILPLWDKWFQTVGPAGKSVMDSFLKLTGMK